MKCIGIYFHIYLGVTVNQAATSKSTTIAIWRIMTLFYNLTYKITFFIAGFNSAVLTWWRKGSFLFIASSEAHHTDIRICNNILVKLMIFKSLDR